MNVRFLSTTLLLVLTIPLAAQEAAEVRSSAPLDHSMTNPDLALGFRHGVIDPVLPFTLSVDIVNLTWSAATNVDLTLDVPRATGFLQVPDGCSATAPTLVRCTFASVPPRTSVLQPEVMSLEFVLGAPDDASGSFVTGTGTLQFDPTDGASPNTSTFSAPMYRTFYVTRRDDSGEGTLRSAIESANAECGADDLCKIAFRIEPAENETWQTITVQSPLPVVRGSSLVIDGDIQHRFFGDRNPDGPEIELNGSALDAGDGLRLETACYIDLDNLAINGFPGTGIVAAGNDTCALERLGATSRIIRRCHVGTDPTGTVAVPNHRGIAVAYATRMVELPSWQDAGPGAWRIEDNLVSGNTRSGIASFHGARSIARNTIGLDRNLTSGLGNGASGIYVGPDSHGTEIAANHIAFNHDFGVAIDPRAENVGARANSIHANWQGGIDIGLDGLTPVIGPFPEGGNLHIPEIREAFWDPEQGVTIIRGVLPEPGDAILGYIIGVYSNDAPDRSSFGEGQYFLGETHVDRPLGAFEFRSPLDLRGTWISATATRSHYVGFAKPPGPSGSEYGFLTTTSEFSRSVPVQ